MNDPSPLPHKDFVAALEGASYDRYAALPDARVAGAEALEEMRRHLLDLRRPTPPAVGDAPGSANQMGFWLTGGAWVFYFAGEPIGSCPLSWFTVDGVAGPMTWGADRIRVGGEVGSGLSTWPSMGSGLRADQGYLKAAYHRGVYVDTPDGGAEWARLSEAGAVVGPCFSVDIHNTTAPDWSTYLFYGGGGSNC